MGRAGINNTVKPLYSTAATSWPPRSNDASGPRAFLVTVGRAFLEKAKGGRARQKERKGRRRLVLRVRPPAGGRAVVQPDLR